MSNTKFEIESDDSNDKGILSVFIATVDPIKGIVEVVDEEEDLTKSKFKKMDDQDDLC